MLGHEAEEARNSLGLRRVDLAVEKGVTPDVVEAWETGRIKVPERIAIDLRWRLAQKERLEALASSGLPECQWIADFEHEAVPAKSDQRRKRFQRLVDHMQSCAVCNAREKYVTEHFGPMPPAPREGLMAIIIPIAERIQKLPPWAQPAATGATFFVAYSLVRLLFLLPAIARDPAHGILAAATGILASASLGAVLGLLYGFFRRSRKQKTADRVA
jgi:transcriptional regulator with XRE-family HTH domain